MPIHRISRMLGGGHGGDSDGECDDSCQHTLFDVKIGLLVGVGIVTFVASLAPWMTKRCFHRNSLDVINIMSAFAAGIVFGAFASHMIPDSSASFEEYMTEAYKDDPDSPMIEYPWTSLCVGGVLILLVSVDRLVIARGMHGTDDEHSHDHISKAFADIRVAELEKAKYGGGSSGNNNDNGGDDDNMSSKDTSSSGPLIGGGGGGTTGLGGGSNYGTVAASVMNSPASSSSSSIVPMSVVSSASAMVSAHRKLSEEEENNNNNKHTSVKITTGNHGDKHTSTMNRNKSGHGHSHGGGSNSGYDDGEGNDHHVHGREVSAEHRAHAKRDAAARAYIFFFALSLHATFDGLSLGSEATLEGFYSILAAVVSHKIFDGLALGVPVYLAELPAWQTWGALLICAAATPIGIGIGMGATAAVSGQQTILVEAIVVGLSAGSFLYISLMELFPASIHDGRYVKSKLAAFVAGWGVMVILAGYV